MGEPQPSLGSVPITCPPPVQPNPGLLDVAPFVPFGDSGPGGDFSGSGTLGIPPSTGGSAPVMCICFYIDPEQLNSAPPLECNYIPADVSAGELCGLTSPSPCNTGGCVAVPFPPTDADNDGVYWPLDTDEPCPFDPGSDFADEDGDGLPNRYDLFPLPNSTKINPNGLLPIDLTFFGAKQLLSAALDNVNPAPKNINELHAFIGTLTDALSKTQNDPEFNDVTLFFGPDVTGPLNFGNFLVALDSYTDKVVKDKSHLSASVINFAHVFTDPGGPLFSSTSLEASAKFLMKSASDNMDIAMSAAKNMKFVLEMAFMSNVFTEDQVDDWLLEQVADLDLFISGGENTQITLHGAVKGIAAQEFEYWKADILSFTKQLFSVVADSSSKSILDLDADNVTTAPSTGWEMFNPNVWEHDDSEVGDPVLTGTGDLWIDNTDLSGGARGLGWSIRRTYSSARKNRGVLGEGWSMPLLETYAMFGQKAAAQSLMGSVLVSWGDGNVSTLVRDEDDGAYWIGQESEFGKGAFRSLESEAGLESAQGDTLVFVLRRPSGLRYIFCPPSIASGAGNGVCWLYAVADSFGNATHFVRDDFGRVLQIVDSLGNAIDLTYQDDHLVEVEDYLGRKVNYTYNPTGQLVGVARPTSTYLTDSNVLAEGRDTINYQYESEVNPTAPSSPLFNNIVTVSRNSSNPHLQYIYSDVTEDYSYDRVLIQAQFDQGANLASHVIEFEYEKLLGDSGTADQYGQFPDHVTRVLDSDGVLAKYYHLDGRLIRREVVNGTCASFSSAPSGAVNVGGAPGLGAWVEIHEYNENGSVVSSMRTSDVAYPLGRLMTIEYDSGNSDRFQQNNVTEKKEYPEGGGTPRITQYLAYDPLTTSPILTLEPNGQQHGQTMGHMQASYADVKINPQVAGWGILPDIGGAEDAKAQYLSLFFGLGDRNGDGSVTDAWLLPVETSSPVVEYENQDTGQLETGILSTELLYNGAGQIEEKHWPNGRVDKFSYYQGRLWKVEMGYGSPSKLTTILIRNSQGVLTSKILPTGRGVEFSYDSAGRLIETREFPEESVQIGRDSHGAAFTPDPRDLVTQTYYDLMGRPVGISETHLAGQTANYSAGTVITLTKETRVDAHGLPSTVAFTSRDSSGQVSTYVTDQLNYDASGQLVTLQRAGSISKVYSYDTLGAVIGSDLFDSQGGVLLSEILERNQYGEMTRSVLNGSTESLYTYTAFGEVDTFLSERGLLYTYQRDASGRVVAEVITKDGHTVGKHEYEYHESGKPKVERSYRYEVPREPVTGGATLLGVMIDTYKYDENFELVSLSSQHVGGATQEIDLGRDALGRIVERSGAGIIGKEVSTYSSIGLLQSVKRIVSVQAEEPGGGFSQGEVELERGFFYDEHGRLAEVVDESGNSYLQSYFPNGKISSKTSPDGTRYEMSYYSNGLLESQLRVDPISGQPLGTIQYDYSPEGFLSKVTHSGGVETLFVRDPLGRISSIAYPDGSLFQVSGYDAFGNPISSTDASGVMVSYSVNAEGNITQTTYSGLGTTIVESYNYDVADNLVSLSITQNGITQSAVGRSYSSLGELLSDQVALASGSTRTSKAIYGLPGVLTSLEYPSGDQVAYLYDGNGQVASYSLNGVQVAGSISGGISGVQGISFASGESILYEQDDFARFTGMQLLDNQDGLVDEFYYLYGLDSGIESFVRGGPFGAQYGFQYDGANRIERWSRTDLASSAVTDDVSLVWSLRDNLVSEFDNVSGLSSSSAESLLDTPTNASLGVSSISFDPFGREISRTGSDGDFTFTWGPNDTLQSASVVSSGIGKASSLKFDAVGRPIEIEDSSLGSFEIAYFGNSIVGIATSTGDYREFEANSGQAPLFDWDASGNLRYYFSRDDGSVLGVLDESGEYLAFDYSPFGRTLGTNATSTAVQAKSVHHRWLGVLDLLDGALVLAGQRVYSPGTKSFMSRDPIGQVGGVNLYSYGLRNPVDYTDVSGLAPKALVHKGTTASLNAGEYSSSGVSIEYISFESDPNGFGYVMAIAANAMLDDALVAGLEAKYGSLDALYDSYDSLGGKHDLLLLTNHILDKQRYFNSLYGGELDETVRLIQDFRDDLAGDYSNAKILSEYSDSLTTATNILDPVGYAIERGVERLDLPPEVALGVTLIGSIVTGHAIGKLGGLLRKAGAAVPVSGCFAASTPIRLADASILEISKVGLGDALLQLEPSDPLAEVFRADGLLEPAVAASQLVVIRITWEDTPVEALLLRSREWLSRLEEAGPDRYLVDVSSMGVSGLASVYVMPTSASDVLGERGWLASGSVSGVFVTKSAHLLELQFAESDFPLSATPQHPFWSLDHEAWVSAQDLEPGELVRTREGVSRLTSISISRGDFEVHNLEVYGSHYFFAGQLGILVHNDCLKAARLAKNAKQGHAAEEAVGQKLGLQKNTASYTGASNVERYPDFTSYDELIEVKFSNRVNLSPQMKDYIAAIDAMPGSTFSLWVRVGVEGLKDTHISAPLKKELDRIGAMIYKIPKF